MEPNQPLHYATPAKPKSEWYWLAFINAWIASQPLALLLEFVSCSYRGRLFDFGFMTIAAILGVVPAAIITVFAKRRWWMAAIIGGSCSPLAIITIHCLRL